MVSITSLALVGVAVGVLFAIYKYGAGMGTSLAGLYRGVSPWMSMQIAPAFRPEFVPTIGVQIELPDWIKPKSPSPQARHGLEITQIISYR